MISLYFSKINFNYINVKSVFIFDGGLSFVALGTIIGVGVLFGVNLMRRRIYHKKPATSVDDVEAQNQPEIEESISEVENIPETLKELENINLPEYSDAKHVLDSYKIMNQYSQELFLILKTIMKDN